LEQRDASQKDQQERSQVGPASGFAGLSQRCGKKPVIAAVNGLGGGFEICLNWFVFPRESFVYSRSASNSSAHSDMVVTAPMAEFALPKVLRGQFAGAGGLARIVRNCGMQIGSELALTGRRLTAQEAHRLNLINRIPVSDETVLGEAFDSRRRLPTTL
jgi:enoyl-CoA hydratase/carnithine racemase